MSAPAGEFAFIDEIRRAVRADPRVPLGIGDDAALVLAAAAGMLVTTDMLMEGTDFTFPPANPRVAGRKALAVNLSDIAAMAGKPVAAFVSLALPRGRGIEFAREFQVGLQDLAGEFGVCIAGGDTNAWDGPLVASVTLLGEPTGRGAVTRGGAQPGDWILCTGGFGGSIHARHLTFTPRVREAQALHAATDLHAMIDISDGLAADLYHILDESRVGAILDADAIPIHPDTARDPSRSPLDQALADGEDFELLFTVSPEAGKMLLAQSPCDVSLSRIGEVTSSRDAWLRNSTGQLTPLERRGWQHSLGKPQNRTGD